MVVLDNVSALLVVVVGFDAKMESAGDLRAPRLIHIYFHLGQEPIKLGLTGQIDAGERGGGGGGGGVGGGRGGHDCMIYDEEIS